MRFTIAYSDPDPNTAAELAECEWSNLKQSLSWSVGFTVDVDVVVDVGDGDGVVDGSKEDGDGVVESGKKGSGR